MQQNVIFIDENQEKNINFANSLKIENYQSRS